MNEHFANILFFFEVRVPNCKARKRDIQSDTFFYNWIYFLFSKEGSCLMCVSACKGKVRQMDTGVSNNRKSAS